MITNLTSAKFHIQENEMVVHTALQEFETTFELEDTLPDWSCRGLPLFPESNSFI